MIEYIPRQAAIAAVIEARMPDTTPDGTPIANGKRSVSDCVRRIRDIPAADVQTVVRCKDCKHFHLDYWGIVNGANIIVAHEICDLWAGGCKTMQNAFCSNGVRKDGET